MDSSKGLGAPLLPTPGRVALRAERKRKRLWFDAAFGAIFLALVVAMVVGARGQWPP